MNCEEVRDLLGALVDDELPEWEYDTVQQHVQQCADCSQELAQLTDLRQQLKALPSYPAPDRLRATLRLQIDDIGRKPAVSASRPAWLQPIATHIAAALAGAILVYAVSGPPEAPGIQTRDLVAAHVRSMMDDRLTQVTAGDPHQVAPWFAGKIDYAPKVTDLKRHGYPLLGGRLDYLADRTIATLVYQRRQHRINLFVLPANIPTTATTMRLNHNGYNIVGFRAAGFAFWAISDVNEVDLLNFTKYYVLNLTE